MKGTCVALVVVGAAALSAVSASLSHAATARGDCTARRDPPPDFGSTPCPGVRPGAPVRIDLPVMGTPPGAQCTLGFMFRAGRDRYMSTAAHCVGEASETTWAPGTGAVAYDDDRRRIGEVAYSVNRLAPAATEFDLALIRLDRGVKASPEMCHFGGPTGVNDDIVPLSTPPHLVELHYYGNTFAGGYVPGAKRWVLPARTGFSNGLPHPRRLHLNGHVSFVDSGSPVVTDDGRAVALISGPGGADASGYAGIVNAPRLAHQIERAEQVLGIDLRLATAARRASSSARTAPARG